MNIVNSHIDLNIEYELSLCMLFSKIQSQIQTNLAKGKGGWEAQKLMAPTYRQNMEEYIRLKQHAKLSAVMVLLFERANETILVLTQRHEYNGVHSGQVSLPGGRHESTESILETAIRECYEEIGVQLEVQNIVATLSEVYIPPSNFLMHPFVALSNQIPVFTKQESEVKSILEIPLSTLFHHHNKREVDVKVSGGMKVKVPAYVIDDTIVWGATAIVLSELEQLLQS